MILSVSTHKHYTAGSVYRESCSALKFIVEKEIKLCERKWEMKDKRLLHINPTRHSKSCLNERKHMKWSKADEARINSILCETHRNELKWMAMNEWMNAVTVAIDNTRRRRWRYSVCLWTVAIVAATTTTASWSLYKRLICTEDSMSK